MAPAANWRASAPEILPAAKRSPLALTVNTGTVVVTQNNGLGNNAGTTTVTGNVGSTSGNATGGYGVIGGTLNGSAMLSVERGFFSSGSMGGTVTLRLTGASTKASSAVLNMNGGTIRNEGTMTQPASADFNLDSSSSAGAGTIINTGTIDHIAFLATQPEAFAERIEAAGLKARKRYFAEFRLFQLFVQDPDGLTIELNFPGLDREPDWGSGGESYAEMPRAEDR